MILKLKKLFFFCQKNQKYFTDYLYDDYKIKPLHIMLPKPRPYYVISYVQTKWMCFLIEDDNLLEKYNTIWDKVRADTKKDLIENLSITKKI